MATMAAILDFQSAPFEFFLDKIDQSIIPTNFKGHVFFGFREDEKIKNQDGHHGSHFGFWIKTI